MKILITGASSGMGHFLAEQLAKQGHTVWGVSRTPPQATGKAISFRWSRCDVSDWSATEALAKEIQKEWGALDALIAAAGFQGEVGLAMSCDPLQWSKTVQGNIDATYFPIRALFPLLRQSSTRAKVLCFSGGGATGPRSHFTGYGIAKTAIVRLVETLAEEWKDLAIDINSVAPGAIKTAMTEEVVRLGPQRVGQREYESAVKTLETGGGSLEKVLGLIEVLLSARSHGLSGKLIAAQWDPWGEIESLRDQIQKTESYTLRRILPS